MTINNSGTATAPNVLIPSLTDGKVARRYIPNFEKKPHEKSTVIYKRVAAALDKHDWNRNKQIIQLRDQGGKILKRVTDTGEKIYRSIAPRRQKMHKYRSETMRYLSQAMIFHCEWSSSTDYMFEIMLSVEELAREIGQFHEYDSGYDGDEGQYAHGRISYDPVLGALRDWEAAELIIVVKEFDKTAGQFKASRIFLRPEFFKSLGFTKKEINKMVNGLTKARSKSASNKPFKRSRPLSDKIANFEDKHSLKNMLLRMRGWFTGANQHLEAQLKQHDEYKEQQRKPKPGAQSELDPELNNFLNSIPPIKVTIATKEIKADNPNIDNKGLQRLLVERFKPKQ